ncbi:hypothetical protein GFL84_19645 [Rhizobium leguminosarum bv. viciae]|nr:hypothetical protein [Rhizobium leguminosarum bv. viciae]
MSQESSAPSPWAREFLLCSRVIHGADAPWLDSCDKHRNEGGEVGACRFAQVGGSFRLGCGCRAVATNGSFAPRRPL